MTNRRRDTPPAEVQGQADIHTCLVWAACKHTLRSLGGWKPSTCPFDGQPIPNLNSFEYWAHLAVLGRLKAQHLLGQRPQAQAMVPQPLSNLR